MHKLCQVLSKYEQQHKSKFPERPEFERSWNWSSLHLITFHLLLTIRGMLSCQACIWLKAKKMGVSWKCSVCAVKLWSGLAGRKLQCSKLIALIAMLNSWLNILSCNNQNASTISSLVWNHFYFDEQNFSNQKN